MTAINKTWKKSDITKKIYRLHSPNLTLHLRCTNTKKYYIKEDYSQCHTTQWVIFPGIEVIPPCLDLYACGNIKLYDRKCSNWRENYAEREKERLYNWERENEYVCVYMCVHDRETI